MKQIKASTIIIGSGIAGLFLALKIAQETKENDKIILLTKSNLENSNSYYAQGGMVAVLDSNKNDSVDLHINDTINAGAGLCNKETIKFISENSNDIVKDLTQFGVKFDKNDSGGYTLTKEAAHSVNRILHAGGDATGRQISIALANAVKSNPKIELFENEYVIDLLTVNNKCVGTVALNTNNEYEVFYSNTTILATGGLGQIYKYTTNPIVATGDGFALAYRVGADLQDMEFVQFHPTALAIDTEDKRFLISEAVRGEGAILCDNRRNPFMQKYHILKDLAPRDIVARSIFNEMKLTKSSKMFLNATVIDKDKLAKRFPTIMAVCKKYNIDIAKDLIPVAPAAHYFMGGVKTNIKGETSIKNLYAIGEVASTGLHGANRLASNSILECVVCANKVAKEVSKINESLDNIEIQENLTQKYCEKKAQTKTSNFIDIESIRSELKNIMWNNVGIERSETLLINAQNQIHNMKSKLDINNLSTKDEYELFNMVTTAELVINAALNRKESRGAHYRTDYKEQYNEGLHSLINKDKDICYVK